MIDPFLKNKPPDVRINNDSTEKLKINPFGQDKAIEKCVLKRDVKLITEDSCLTRDNAS